LVREGPDVGSSKCPERLSHGAYVEELSVLEDRLHYRLLRGTGPEDGWVSTRLPHKDLVVKRLSGRTATCSEEPTGATAGPGAVVPPGAVVADDPNARSLLNNKLTAGSRHLRQAICDHNDYAIFNALRAELNEGIRPWSGNWRPGNGGEWKTPWRNGMGSEQVEDLKGRSLWAHASVLQKLAETFNADMQMWWTNFYEEGSVGCEFHHDGHAEFNITAGASFGATRDLSFVHAATGCKFSFCQVNGDVFAFDESVDSAFTHGVFPAEDEIGPRISVIMMGRVSSRSISTKLESMQRELHAITHGSPSTIAWLQDNVTDLQQKQKRLKERIKKQAESLGDAGDLCAAELELEAKRPELKDCSLAELHDIIRKLQDNIKALQAVAHRPNRQLKPH